MGAIHTKGKWECRRTPNDDIASFEIQSNGTPIGAIYNELPISEAEANAKHIVKCVNMHNEAMEVILGFIRASSMNEYPDKPSMSDIYSKAADLMNRAEFVPTTIVKTTGFKKQ